MTSSIFAPDWYRFTTMQCLLTIRSCAVSASISACASSCSVLFVDCSEQSIFIHREEQGRGKITSAVSISSCMDMRRTSSFWQKRRNIRKVSTEGNMPFIDKNTTVSPFWMALINIWKPSFPFAPWNERWQGAASIVLMNVPTCSVCWSDSV